MNAARSLIAALLSIALAAPVPAQVSGAGEQPPPSGAEASAKTYAQEELVQLLAPIALYPDSLLAQMLMASTYPLEVVAAERWVKANPDLKEQALADALQQQPWDASVKSLAVFPQVLAMMSEKIDWTQKLGDAFLAQQKDVLDTVQVLRSKAAAQGTLKGADQIRVSAEQTGTLSTIIIEPADPEVLYVPIYDPYVAYGTWPYTYYPPYYWYPPGYVAGAALIGFTAGIVVGGALWGRCVWGGGSVDIDINRYNNFNRTNISRGEWKHNPAHRGAVPYRDGGAAQQYGRGQAADAATREAFRGRADAGREAIQRGEVASDFGGRDVAAGRDLGSRDPGGRDYSGTERSNAFDNSRSAQTRDFSSRGTSSINSSRSSGNFGGGARTGGGGRGGRR